MKRDPWYFQRWALEQRVGNGTRKLVLWALSTMAESNTGYCFAAQADLAHYAECSVRSVRRHLEVLEEQRFLARHRRHTPDGNRAPDGFLLLAPGIECWPWGEPTPSGQSGLEATLASGQTEQGLAATAVADERPLNDPDKVDRARAREEAKRSLPADFPEELREHARIAFRVLREVAEQHAAREVTPRALGLVVMARQRKPLVQAAYDFAAWAANPPRPIRDVVASYRSWLDRCPDLAAPERLEQAASEQPQTRRQQRDAALLRVVQGGEAA